MFLQPVELFDQVISSGHFGVQPIQHQGASSKNHMKTYPKFMQVSTCSIQVCQGINAWNTFVLRVEHPYIVRKSEKSLDKGEPTFHAKKLHANPGACCRFSMANYSPKSTQ